MRLRNRNHRHGQSAPRSKSTWWVGGCLFALLLVAATLLVYPRWERGRLLDKAEESLDGGDVGKASIYLSAAYESGPENIRTLSLLVELFERISHPSVMRWDERLLRRLPGSIPDRLRAARHAMQFEKPDVALRLLAEMPQAGSEPVEYDRLVAAACGAEGQSLTDVRKHLQLAADKQPGENLDALNLAAFDALASQPGSRRRQAAVARIGQLAASDGGVAPWALLMLVKIEAPAHGERSAGKAERGSHLERLIELVDEDTNLRYSLLALDATHAYGGDGWRKMLLAVRAHADDRATPQPTFWTMDWMNRRGLFEESIGWSESTASAKAREFPASLALAESYLGARRWSDLQTFLQGQDWPNMGSLRLAMEAVAVARGAERSGQYQIAAIKQEQALERASRSEAGLRLLEFAARKHQWDELHEQVLWKIAEARNVRPKVALGACARLKRRYLAAGNLKKSFEVARRSVEIMPTDFIETNNLIYTSLLMGGSPEAQLARARQLHDRHPGIRPIISTCALAHFFSGDIEGASQLVHELPQAFRDHPAIAPFCGIILAHAGEIHRAKQYLARPAALHFDEERALVTAAKNLVGL